MLKESVKNVLIIISSGICFLLTACFNPGAGNSAGNNIKSSADDAMKISWQEPVKQKDKTVITGSAKADFGRFEFKWVMNADGISKLITMEPAGSGELPLMEKKVLPMVLPDGTTLLFKERIPLLNEKKPSSIRVVTGVSTSDLFSVFTVVKLPPAAAIPKTSSEIKWGKVYDKKGIKYLEGRTKSSHGSLNLLWKKVGSSNPQLVVLDSPGAGELPVVEVKLYPWMDEASGFSYICRERFPLLNQGYSSYLWCLTTVKTEELLLGFDLIYSAVSVKK